VQVLGYVRVSTAAQALEGISLAAQMHALRESGLSSQAVATALNRAGTPPLSGQQWYPSVVRRVLLPTVARGERSVA
jgi:hypothetical protein